ncbi:hypothetical protein AOLI_G00103780 [Acnodon oligacanthus]
MVTRTSNHGRLGDPPSQSYRRTQKNVLRSSTVIYGRYGDGLSGLRSGPTSQSSRRRPSEMTWKRRDAPAGREGALSSAVGPLPPCWGETQLRWLQTE